jgi:Cof subfamily protein (haloacid dehalogenase superfamily)
MARMLASDLDGTLLRSDGTIGPRTAAALRRAREIGFPVAFVTGRPPRWLPDVAAQTEHHGLAACANGAVLYDLATDTVVSAHPIPNEVAAAVVARLQDAIPGVTFAVERFGDEDTSFAHDHHYRPRWPAPPGTPIGRIDKLIADGNVVKLLARADRQSDHDADSLLDLAAINLAGLVEVTHSNADDVLLEISALGVSKASGLAELAARAGVDRSDVVAVGDMPNDLPMLRWAGRAFAVANAHPQVLAEVPDHVAANDSEGVADLLESLLAARM